MTQFEALILGVIAGALLHSKDVVVPELQKDRLAPDEVVLRVAMGSKVVRVWVEEVK